MNYKLLHFFVVLLPIRNISGIFNFLRTIEAVGYPYYKIQFSMGTCKVTKLFEENKIWGSVKLNRVFDIYYKTDDGDTISRVEINLVMNNTNCISQSKTGVGKTEFSAVLILPTSVGRIFYSLSIFSCTPVKKYPYYDEEETDYGLLESSELYSESD
ncbi:uncharacterized protein LOC114353368 [Ostrinia furnacalis]|uniref:uncharacterized protein LOC114353368 n=1 Tax=Ostrinia furnacalis TaxID=93504 RepID=UPI00103872FF|nr:uncharacterized protein LOC114353368 [Ostrinia furnacalis]